MPCRTTRVPRDDALAAGKAAVEAAFAGLDHEKACLARPKKAKRSMEIIGQDLPSAASMAFCTSRWTGGISSGPPTISMRAADIVDERIEAGRRK